VTVAAPEEITIDYQPRVWADAFHGHFRRWSALVLHRRCGKTTATLNQHLRAAVSDDWCRRYLLTQKPDLQPVELQELLRYRMFGHILPQLKQAKLTSWEMLKYYASFIPGAKPHESETRIDIPVYNETSGKLKPGHVRRVQLFGADHIDAIRGAAFFGLSLDEYGQHPPSGFGDVLSKCLADHLGYCIWEGTIKGKNQLYRVHQAGKGDPAWFTLWQDIDHSLQTEEDAAITMLRQAMEDDRALVTKGIMTQEEFDQEWYLSTEAAIRGAYYGKLIAQARRDGRITRVPFDPMLPVDTDWDLGIDDETAIWFSQSLRSGEVRLIDYVHGHDAGLDAYWRLLQDRQRERGYVYGEHWAPHDIEVREMTTGKTRKEIARAMGLTFKVTPKLSLADGINAVRMLLPRCWFDEERCAEGLEALIQYQKGWNEHTQQFTDDPIHSWASHGADACRGLAVRHRTPEAAKPRQRQMFEPRTSAGTGWMAG